MSIADMHVALSLPMPTRRVRSPPFELGIHNDVLDLLHDPTAAIPDSTRMIPYAGKR